MSRPLILAIALVLSVLHVAAQSPKELLLAIQKSKPDTDRIILQLKVGNYYLLKRDQYKSGLDSAINFYNQASDLSIKLHQIDWQYKIMGMIGNYYAETGDLKRGKDYFRRIIAYHHYTGNFGKEADTWEWLGEVYDNNVKNNHHQDWLKCYQQALLLYLQNHRPLEAATVLSKIAGVRINLKQFDLAENELKQVLTQYNVSGYKNLQYTYNRLQSLEYSKGNYYRAMAYCLEGIRSMKNSGDTTLAGPFYESMFRSNDAVKKYKYALEWIRKAISINGKTLEYKYELIQTLLSLNRIEEARLILNNLSKERPALPFSDKLDQYRTLALYYDKTNKNELSIRYYKKVLELYDGKFFDEGLRNSGYITCTSEIAGVYLKANQAAKAKNYIQKAAMILKNGKTAIDPDLRVMHYNNLYKYHVAVKDYRAAILDLALRVQLQDSLFTADKDKQLTELDIQYQTVQQEQSIKDLHSQGAAQQVKMEKANLQKNITVGGIIMMILVSAWFYRNYRQKQAANQVITHKNELLQHLLTEKEWLLKEVHHRVKNNLHTVICLLESQARYLENDALKAIENSQHRIYAMSLIHQKLYQSDDIKTIDMSDYIPELVQSLEDGFVTSNRVKFNLRIDPVSLDISHAIPLGLIINEAVTNSIKYAFPDNRKGEISISMIGEGEQVKLELADDGIGMPQIDHEGEPESLGLRLMKGLSEDIDADIRFTVRNGTQITLNFKRDDLSLQENISESSVIKEMLL